MLGRGAAKHVLLAVTAVLLLFSTTVSAEEVEVRRNLLFISIDDMNIDPQAITPNLDAFAQASTVYTNAYTTSLWCLPSRTASLFGISPGRHGIGMHGVYGNAGTPEHKAVYGNPAVQSLPEIFSSQGYTSASTGKMFHLPQPKRWDINGPTDFYDESVLTYEGPLKGFINRGVFPADLDHPDQVSADWAASFLQGVESQQAPFFLAVGFHLPHLPLVSPQWAYDLYDGVPIKAHSPVPGDLDDEPPIAVNEYTIQTLFPGTEREITLYELVTDLDEALPITRAYLAAISHTDAMIGQVLSALADSPHAKNTDVIIWSDHGFQILHHFRIGKQAFHEYTARVPLMIRGEGLPAGRVTSPVSLLDLAPTAIDLAYGGTSAQFDGVSLANGSSPVEIYHRDAKATVVGSIKQINYDRTAPCKSNCSTYDLAVDPGEHTNLTPPPRASLPDA